MAEDQWYSYRVVVAGERYMVRKMCAAADGTKVMEALASHRVEVPVGQ